MNQPERVFLDKKSVSGYEFKKINLPLLESRRNLPDCSVHFTPLTIDQPLTSIPAKHSILSPTGDPDHWLHEGTLCRVRDEVRQCEGKTFPPFDHLMEAICETPEQIVAIGPLPMNM